MDDADILKRAYDGTALFSAVFAHGSRGGRITELGDTARAHVVPVAPERSLPNCVTYSDPDELIGLIPEIEALYRDAGIEAWTVWVPPTDRSVADALAASGNRLDAAPLAMGCEITTYERPPEIDRTTEADPALFGPINDRAYGYQDSFTRLLEQFDVADNVTPYVALVDGDPVATTIVGDTVDGDAHVSMVATLPDHQGKGIASALIGHALADARERGLATTTLVATKAGAPVYERLGYRSAGAIEMWERRG